MFKFILKTFVSTFAKIKNVADEKMAHTIIDTLKIRRLLVKVYGLLLLFVVTLQFELYLPALNTVQRRVPTLLTYALGTYACTMYIRQRPLRSFWAFNFVMLYFSSIYLSFVFGANGILHLSTIFPELVVQFKTVYQFPDLLTKVFVIVGFAMYIILPLLLFVPIYKVRAGAMILMFLFNAIDVGILETNTTFTPYYLTQNGNFSFLCNCVALTVVLTTDNRDIFYSLLYVYSPERCSEQQLETFEELALITRSQPQKRWAKSRAHLSQNKV